MAQTTSIATFIPALRAALRAWPALAGVAITAAPVPPAEIASPMIRIGGTENSDQAYVSFGGKARREEYAIGGRLWFIAAEGSGDAALDVALAGAAALYAEVEQCLVADPHVGGTVGTAQPALTRYVPDLFEQGTGVVLEFQVRVVNELR